MTKRNTGVLWSVTQSLNADEKKIAQDNMGLDTLYSSANSDNAGKYVKRVYRDSNGKIVTVQSDTISSFNYNDPSSAPINGVGVKAAIDSITVKVDDDTAALNRLMVTSKDDDEILNDDFYSGLKKVSPAGHSEYSYVSVNCGEGLYISSWRDVGTPGELRLSEATVSTYGGIKIGYSSGGDNYAVELDPQTKRAYVNVPTSSLVNEVTCSHDSVGDLRTDPDRTITYLHQATNGQLSATFSDISIDFSRVHPESSSSYVAGEFVNLVTDDGGKLVPASIVAASKNSSAPSRTSGPVTGDKLMFCYGTSPEYWYSSTSTLSFNTSNTGKCLTQAGTWADFNNYSLPLAANGTRGGIQIGYSESNSGSASNRNYALKLSSEKAYVNVPWSDTKNTVGVGSTNPSANEVFVFPFVRSNSGTSQQSYTQLSAVNLLSVSETSDATDYMLNFNGYTIPKVNGHNIVDSESLLTYSDMSGQLIKAGSCGNSTTPIYINSNGVPTQCSLPVTFELTEGVYSAKPEASTMSLTCSSTDVGASIHLFSDSGLYRYWPSNPSSTNPIGYLAPKIGSSDGGKFLGVNSSDNTVRWLSVPQSTVIGEETTITTGRVWEPYSYRGIIFGDGFEFTPKPEYYNCYPVSLNMGVMEGMSITYALTSLADSTYYSNDCEFYNKNRLLNPSGTGHYYDTAQLYRTATTGTSSSTSYVASTSLPAGASQMDIAVVPPHHFLWMHVMIKWYLDTGGNPFSGNNVYISISIQDSAGTNASPGYGDSRCLVDTYERGVSSDNCTLYRPNYSFIAYNNSDQNKYIHYYQGTASQLGATIYKQMILFKAPGYGGTDQPNMESI